MFQTRRVDNGYGSCDCSTGSGKNRKSCTKAYECYRLYGTVDYGGGEIVENVPLYDKEANLGGKVGCSGI